MTGKLYLCATPIGNLEDVTFRVIRTLKEVDLIAAEDTRQSIKLLNHYEIKTPLTSYHEHNKRVKSKVLIEKMLSGQNIALVTDAGTPGISDPGEDLVVEAHQAGIEVTSLPGAAACIVALTMSGMPTRRFCFEGFLPVDKKDREFVLNECVKETRTMIFYEAPHRLCKTLEEFQKRFGDREIVVCKELTKKHETVMPIALSEALDYYKENEPRGEQVIIIKGKNPEEIVSEERKKWEEITLEEHLDQYLRQGIEKKEAMKKMAKDRGVTKREIYQKLLD